MKRSAFKYRNKKYDWAYSLFLQRSIVMMFLKDTIKEDNTLRIALEVDAWRYVFEKDISKSQIIKNLTRDGIGNLVALEAVNRLNEARKLVDEITKQEDKK